MTGAMKGVCLIFAVSGVFILRDGMNTKVPEYLRAK
jgi:hypothetical protein